MHFLSHGIGFRLTRGYEFKLHICNLNICSSFVYLKVHSEFCLVCLTHVDMWPYVKESVKHDIHIKLKSYKIELLEKLVI